MKQTDMRIFHIMALLLIPVVLLSDPLPGSFYIAQGDEDVRIRGEYQLDRLGQTLCAQGDVNGDGYFDLLIGAPEADGPVGSGSGKTYVFYGAPSFPDTIDLTVASADVTISGMMSGEWSGYSLASGDLNGDGFDDIVIGALYSSVPYFYHGGRVYVIFGSASLSMTINLSVDSADVVISGGGTDYRLGAAVAVGDINGGGIDDLIISATYADAEGISNGGQVYAFFGTDSWEPRINLATTPADITFLAGNSEDHLGTALAVGDVNGDAYDDLVIGAPDADPSQRSYAGKLYAIYGEPSFADTFNLGDTDADLEIFGGTAGIRLGSSAAIGDFDFRGYGEIVTGAPYATTVGGTGAGAIYLFIGNSELSGIIDLHTAAADLTINGANSQDNAGTALAMGDVNGDGHCDLFIGAHNADVGGQTEAGISYLIYGQSLVPPMVFNLGEGASDVTVYGSLDNDFVGRALGISDLNADGFGDLIIGASGADPPGGSSAGETYLIFGDGVNPNFASYRSIPSGNQPKVRFRQQNAWIKFVNGTQGVVQTSKKPSRPQYTSPYAAQVWWEITTTKTSFSNVQVEFRYTDEQISGLYEDYLKLWRRSQTTQAFLEITSTVVDPATNRVSASINNLGQFTISDIFHPLAVPNDDKAPAMVGSYSLHPPSPNPFNASVALRYELPASGHVILSIFNVLGQEVATVVNENQMPGRYSLIWDSGEAASGIYFAVLKVNNFEAVRKILLLR